MKKTRPVRKIVDSKITGILLLFFLSTFIITSLWFHRKLNKSQKQRYLSYIAADELRQSSDDLTRMVRTYVVTKDPRYEKMYWDILAIRNGQMPRPLRYENIYWDFIAVTNEKPRPDGQKISLLEIMKGLEFTQQELAKLKEAETHCNDLVKTEMIAMKGRFLNDEGEFIPGGQPDYDYARKLLYDESYHKDKVSIMTPIDEFFVLVNARTEAQVKKDAICTYIVISLVYMTIALLLWLARLELNERRIVQTKIAGQARELVQINKLLRAGNQQTNAINQQLIASEQQLRASQQELSFKNEELQSIVYISSHDLKTPLVNINGFSAMKELLEKCDMDTDTKKEITSLLNDGIPTDLDYISTSTERMKRLIEGLLQVSRIGTVEFKTQNINMNDMVSEIMNNVKYKTEELDAEIAFENLPDCTGDKDQITQVFTNLIDNALKYLSPKRNAA